MRKVMNFMHVANTSRSCPLTHTRISGRFVCSMDSVPTEIQRAASPSKSRNLYQMNSQYCALVALQVRHAEEAGAAGAIVYDDVYEALIIMSKPRDHPEPGIPAVFVAQKTGIVMKKLMTPASTLVRITPVRPLRAWACLGIALLPGKGPHQSCLEHACIQPCFTGCV